MFDSPKLFISYSVAYAGVGSEVHLGFIDASNPSGVIANHIAAGILGILGGAFHLS